MRVLHVIDSLGLGGAQSVLATLAAASRQCGIDVRIAALHGPGEAAERFERADLRVEWMASSRFDPGMAWRLVQCVRRFRPDVVHAHLVVSTMMVERLRVVFPRGTRVVAHLHSQYRPPSRPDRYQNTLETYLYWRSDVVVACGVAPARSLADARPRATRAPIVVVPNAVEDAELQGRRPGDRVRLRRMLRIEERAPVFLSASRLVPPKNLDYAIRVFAQVRREVPQARYLIAGSGPEESRLRAQVRSLQLESAVEFLGFRSDVGALLSAADFCLLTSQYEGFPVILPEAQGKDVVAIATPFDGCDAVVRDGRTGIVIPSNDEAGAARRIMDVIRSPETAARIAAAGRERARRKFSASRMAARMETVYRRLIGARR